MVTAVTFPPGRYGRRREPRRRRGAALAAGLLVVAAAFGLAVVLYQRYGNPQYDPRVVRFGEITDQQIVIEFRVAVPAGSKAICLVRARSRDGAEVGHAEVPVAAEPGRTTATTTYRLATTARPVVGEVPRCRPA